MSWFSNLASPIVNYDNLERTILPVFPNCWRQLPRVLLESERNTDELAGRVNKSCEWKYKYEYNTGVWVALSTKESAASDWKLKLLSAPPVGTTTFTLRLYPEDGEARIQQTMICYIYIFLRPSQLNRAHFQPDAEHPVWANLFASEGNKC